MAWGRNSGGDVVKAGLFPWCDMSVSFTSFWVQLENTCLAEFNSGITFRQNLLASL